MGRNITKEEQNVISAWKSQSTGDSGQVKHFELEGPTENCRLYKQLFLSEKLTPPTSGLPFLFLFVCVLTQMPVESQMPVTYGE